MSQSESRDNEHAKHNLFMTNRKRVIKVVIIKNDSIWRRRS